MNSQEAQKLIGLARKAVEKELFGTKIPDIRDFREKRGVFVTLTLEGRLRGCIGFIEPLYPLAEAVIKAAKSAAFEDPRFEPLHKDEYEEISFEISVLSVPRIVKMPEKILQVGRDGIIIRNQRGSGVLLPQVAVDHGWNEIEFLEHTCDKAGLDKDAWKESDIYLFQADVYAETEEGIKKVC